MLSWRIETTDKENIKILTVTALCVALMIAIPLMSVTSDDTDNVSDYESEYVSDAVSDDVSDDELIGEKALYGLLRESNGEKFWYRAHPDDGRIRYEITSENTCKIVDYKGHDRDLKIPDVAIHNGHEYVVNEVSANGLSTWALGRHPHTVELAPTIEILQNNAISCHGAAGDITWKITIRDVEHSKLRYIGDRAFSYCNIKEMVLPKTVEYIGDHAFEHCEKMEKCVITSECPLVIKNGAFEGCHHVRDMNLSMVTEIGTCVFEYCYDLGVVDISSAKTVGYYAFDRAGITEIKFGDHLEQVDGKMCKRTFVDLNGNKINLTADNLRGHVYKYIDGQMHQVAE